MSFPLSDPLLSPPKGYASPDYLASLGQTPLPFGATGGFLAARAIGQSGQSDLKGAWPMFTCGNWQDLAQAVQDLPQGPVTLTLVTDPFSPLSPSQLAAIFPMWRNRTWLRAARIERRHAAILREIITIKGLFIGLERHEFRQLFWRDSRRFGTHAQKPRVTKPRVTAAAT